MSNSFGFGTLCRVPKTTIGLSLLYKIDRITNNIYGVLILTLNFAIFFGILVNVPVYGRTAEIYADISATVVNKPFESRSLSLNLNESKTLKWKISAGKELIVKVRLFQDESGELRVKETGKISVDKEVFQYSGCGFPIKIDITTQSCGGTVSGEHWEKLADSHSYYLTWKLHRKN